jgi:hypothetical protein
MSAFDSVLKLAKQWQPQALPTELTVWVGQIESLEPKKNPIIVVLCGETNPALMTRLRQRYGGPSEKAVVFIPFAVVEKPVGKT